MKEKSNPFAVFSIIMLGFILTGVIIGVIIVKFESLKDWMPNIIRTVIAFGVIALLFWVLTKVWADRSQNNG